MLMDASTQDKDTPKCF